MVFFAKFEKTYKYIGLSNVNNCSWNQPVLYSVNKVSYATVKKTWGKIVRLLQMSRTQRKDTAGIFYPQGDTA